ncbi:hypothetical protein CSOJ01_12409 [Colletotrichum sojae]|uniref:Uncharacterized protein n=1 Tax=Colletotrichum sojae TaxID=2175907 RepID=A0A8H6IV50_9PEZI|nr:hypothetical protein CSOJ01_12409 [Colletotrichum sojae]
MPPHTDRHRSGSRRSRSPARVGAGGRQGGQDPPIPARAHRIAGSLHPDHQQLALGTTPVSPIVESPRSPIAALGKSESRTT